MSDFRRFLNEQGHVGELVWVLHDDLWFWGPDHVLMHYPPPAGNESLAQKVYDEGRERELVGVTAVATAKGHVATRSGFPSS